jgi:divalent metal cation (Fe/Co/Zn/Cd) transporter
VIKNGGSGRLRSTPLAIAFLVFFIGFLLALSSLLRLVTGLAALLTLPLLAGRRALLSLSGLTALLVLFFHIVCHKILSSWEARDHSAPLEFIAINSLSCF